MQKIFISLNYDFTKVMLNRIQQKILTAEFCDFTKFLLQQGTKLSTP